MLIFNCFLAFSSNAQSGDKSVELYEESYQERDSLIVEESSSYPYNGEDTLYGESKVVDNEEYESKSPVIAHHPDTTLLEWKKFDEEKLKELVAEGGFEYMQEEKKEKGSGLGIAELIEVWLQSLFKEFFITPETRKNTRISIYIISVVVVILVIAQIFSGEIRSLFYGGGKKTKTNTYVEEKELPSETLSKELEKAILEKDFSKAIRMSYILMLRNLAEKGHIRWKIDKTNHEYEFEIVDENTRKKFSEATYYYEYVCYGGFAVDEQLFQKAKSVMSY
ncbi:MAG: hypothetical protein OHK0038_24910 [Flammeovirgaceae bacterium]